MSDIRQRLDNLGTRVRDKAAESHLVEEGYTVYGTPDEADLVNVEPGGFEELTLARYQEGGNFTDSNFNYKVTRGLEVWNHVHGEYEWVETAFTKYGHADLDALYALKNFVAGAAGKLCASPTWFPVSDDTPDDAASTLEAGFDASGNEVLLLVNGMNQLSNWSGAAADTFFDVFSADGTYWSHRLFSDYLLLVALIGALEAKIQLVYTTRHGVVQLGENVIDALDVAAVGSTGSDPSVPLAILGALAGIGFAAAFPLATPLAGAVVGAVISVGTEVIKGMASGDADPGVGKEKELTVDGDTVSAVLQSFSDGLGTISADYDTRDGEIGSRLGELYASCVTNRQADFEVHFDGGPPFAGATEDNFTGDDMLGDSNVTVDPEKLITGAGEFTTAADRILEVNADVAATGDMEGPPFYREVTSGGDRHIDGIQSAWCDIRDLAQDVLAHNGSILQQTAQVMVWAAEDYPTTDADSAQAIQETTNTLADSGTAVTSGNDHDLTPTPVPGGGPNIPV